MPSNGFMLTTAYTPATTVQREIRDMNETFERRYSGTAEASELIFWPTAGQRGAGGDRPTTANAVEMARQRLTAVLRALNAE